MQRQQILGGLLLLALTAAGIAGTAWSSGGAEAVSPEETAYAELLANTPVAEIAGETVSPSGRFEVRAVGASDIYVSGVRVPERIQIVDTQTGEVKWEDQGYITQSALWSPGNNLVALAYGGRTWQAVTVISTAYWTSWDFTLPDGSPIPEYTFLPYDEPWGEWLDPNTLLVTVGRGGDGEEQKTYRCSVFTNSQTGELSGSALEQTTETLPGDYDFDRDGTAELTELVTLWEPESDRAAWYEVQVRKADGSLLWSETAADTHAGENSLYALKLDGQDYLLQYDPYMGQGFCTYSYQLFSLDQDGQPVICKENSVEFDINFGSPIHENFDVKSIAAFLHEVHGYLDSAEELVSTVWGEISLGEVDYSDTAALENALEVCQEELSR